MGTGASSDIAATLAANIKAARAEAGLTQHELVVKLGKGDAMAVSRWERAEHRPSDEALLRLSSVLGRTVAWFYTEHSEQAA